MLPTQEKSAVSAFNAVGYESLQTLVLAWVGYKRF
jgi:hypothetical protein